MLLYIDVASELAFTPALTPTPAPAHLHTCTHTYTCTCTPALTPTPAHLQIIPSDILSGVGCPLVAFSPNRLIKFD